jgi:large subunit ribosomal protein L27e
VVPSKEEGQNQLTFPFSFFLTTTPFSCSIKSNRVVIMLSGRYAGRKAVVVKTFDSGSGDRKFAHALVAGLDRCPRKITKKMDAAKVAKKSKVKAFVKYVNYSHVMPTR